MWVAWSGEAWRAACRLHMGGRPNGTHLGIIGDPVSYSTKVCHRANQWQRGDGHLSGHVPGIAPVEQALRAKAARWVGQLALAAPQLTAGSSMTGGHSTSMKSTHMCRAADACLAVSTVLSQWLMP